MILLGNEECGKKNTVSAIIAMIHAMILACFQRANQKAEPHPTSLRNVSKGVNVLPAMTRDCYVCTTRVCNHRFGDAILCNFFFWCGICIGAVYWYCMLVCMGFSCCYTCVERHCQCWRKGTGNVEGWRRGRVWHCVASEHLRACGAHFKLAKCRAATDN